LKVPVFVELAQRGTSCTHLQITSSNSAKLLKILSLFFTSHPSVMQSVYSFTKLLLSKNTVRATCADIIGLEKIMFETL